jgi:hypothetical protein
LLLARPTPDPLTAEHCWSRRLRRRAGSGPRRGSFGLP